MLTQNEKREALEKIREAVVAASRIMTGAVEIGAKTEAKSSPRDLVTAYDKAVEEYLVGALGHAFPEAKFLGEEGHGAFSAEGLLFIIDPIDGTANFVRGLGQSAISVALAEDGKVKVGVVYNPYREEYYEAAEGLGARLNGKPISARDFTNTILSSGFEHHYPIAWGDLSDEVAEMNAWLGIKPITKIPYENYLQTAEDME